MGLIKRHYVEFHTVHSSSNIIRGDERMRCVRHAAFSKHNRSAHRIVRQKPKMKKPTGKCKGNKNNKMHLTKNDGKH